MVPARPHRFVNSRNASAPKVKVASWTALIHQFLQGRSSLARVYLLIDARHGLKEVDLDVLKTLDKSAVSYQVVLTKADQVKPAELEQRVADVKTALLKHPAACPESLVTSSRTGAGMPASSSTSENNPSAPLSKRISASGNTSAR